MRIGIFDPYLDTLGGGEKYMLTAASCLSKKHEVFLFWDKDIKNKASEKFNIDLSRVKEAKNIFAYDVSLTKRLIKSSKYDAILFLSDGSIPIIACSLYVHFQFPVEWVNAKNLITRQKIKRIKKIICNSEFTKSFIDNKFKKESVVLYPPTYLKNDFPKVEIKDKKNYILNVGRLSKLANGDFFKKQNFLIKTFKKIADKDKNSWELILVVSNTDKDKNLVDELENLAKGYPIQILKNVSHSQLNSIYKKSKIYWHATGFEEDLKKNPEKAEHFGISTVEAMINGGVPVVIGAGGQKEIVDNEKNGFLFNTQNELIQYTKLLIKDEKLWEKMSKKAKDSVKQYSTEAFCEKLYKILAI